MGVSRGMREAFIARGLKDDSNDDDEDERERSQKQRLEAAWTRGEGGLVIGVDPVGSILAGNGEGEVSSYEIEGIGYDFVPKILHPHSESIHRWLKSEDESSFAMVKKVHRLEGEQDLMTSGFSAVNDNDESVNRHVLLTDRPNGGWKIPYRTHFSSGSILSLYFPGLLIGGSSGSALSCAVQWLQDRRPFPEGGYDRIGSNPLANVVVLCADGVRNYMSKPWFVGDRGHGVPSALRQDIDRVMEIGERVGTPEAGKDS